MFRNGDDEYDARTAMVLSFMAVVLYIVIRTAFTPGTTIFYYMDCYVIHVYAVFFSFFLFPLSVLIILKRVSGIIQFPEGFCISVIIYAFLHFFFHLLFSPLPGSNTLYDMALIWMNVTPVDFFTRTVVQRGFSNTYGHVIGIISGSVAWGIGHIPEYLWLSTHEFGGTPITAGLFLILSGVVLSLAYEWRRDVMGMMLGHFLLNVVP